LDPIGSIPDPTSPKPVKSHGQITLRRFVVFAVAFATASFTWHRTNGDQVLTAMIFALTLFTIDVRVADPDRQK
jgi:hypothetical protein